MLLVSCYFLITILILYIIHEEVKALIVYLQCLGNIPYVALNAAHYFSPAKRLISCLVNFRKASEYISTLHGCGFSNASVGMIMQAACRFLNILCNGLLFVVERGFFDNVQI